MARPAKALINLDAITQNLQLARELAPQSKALAVIKGNGYGHGAIAVGRALESDADAFGVACIEEAMELRGAGITLPILLLEGFFSADEIAVIDQQRFDVVIHSQHQIDALLASDPTQPINIWLKMDSGMHRLGFEPEQFVDAYRQLRAAHQVGEIILMSHFARADELDEAKTSQQRLAFMRYADALGAPVSLSNSPAVLAWPDAHQDWIRPGMMLYGASPLDRATNNSARLEPAMELESEIIAVRDLKPGDTVGYGNRYTCDRPTRVGVVAMGYADGFPRNAPNGLPVLVDGERCELIGRVSMDMLTVDITDQPQANIGSKVVFWGRQLPIELIAKRCGTIPYELVTQLTSRVPRVYANAGE